ncbi:MAG: phage protein Gp27 family protein [Candidatus Binataceae bacterium]
MTKLPRALRDELEKRLVDNSFTGYDELTKWLNGLGYRISRGALNRYGRQFEGKLEVVTRATAQARVLTEPVAGDDATATDRLVRLVQQRLFSVLIETERPIPEIDLARLARTIGDLSRTTISQRRWLAEAQDRLAQQQEVAQTKLAELERTGGLSDATAQYMRDVLLGINPFTDKISNSDS